MLSRFIEPLESRQLLSAVDPVISLRILPTTNTLITSERPSNLVIDEQRKQLLALDRDNIWRFDMSTGSPLGVWRGGSFLMGADITVDGAFLYVGEAGPDFTVYKVDLSNGTFRSIPVAQAPRIASPRSLAIRQTQVIVSQQPLTAAGGDVIRTINTDDDSVHTPLTSGGDPFTLDDFPILARSADYNSVALVSSTNDYSYTQSGFAGRTGLHLGRICALSVSRDGALHAIATTDTVIVEDRQFERVKQLPFADAGLEFDPSAEVLYVADPSTDLLRAYDTQSWTELYNIPIGEDLQNVEPAGPGDMAVSDDGASIFLRTNSGIRWIRLPGADLTFGDAIKFQADLSGDGSSAGAPAGTVSFIDTETQQSLGQATVEDGRAILTLSNIHAGVHSILARYSGDANYNPTDSSTLPLTVKRAPTTLILTSIGPGTATMKIDSPAGAPEGGNAYIDYGLLRATATVHAGTASFQHHLPLGNDSIFLGYAGNSDFLPADDVVSVSVRDPSTTTISGPATAAFGSRIPIIARVRTAAGAPVTSGNVTFTEGDQTLASIPFFNGQAEFSTYALPSGLHTIIATFGGNMLYETSVSTALTVKIVPARTTLKLNVLRDYVPKGQFFIFNATISQDISFVPSGIIQLKEGKRILAAAVIGNGAASFDISSLRVGNHSITATYLGDENFKPSSAAAVKVSVASVTTVDLMILYTAQARDTDGDGDIASTINDAVDDTNDALLNSHIPVTIRLVYSGPIDYRESGKFHTDLRRLVLPHDGFLDGVHELRNKKGADLVSLFVSDGDLGGVGFELQDIHDRDNSRRGFSVVWAPHSGAPDFFLAHELGHNFGASHDIQHDPDTGATSFSSGWRFRAQGHLYHDIMSYDPGTTIPYFSNPRIKYRGVPTGSDDADAARTITLTAATVAAYRKSK